MTSSPPSRIDRVSPGAPRDVAEALRGLLAKASGRQPLGVFAAPGRVNLIGEHVDYNGGRCLPMSLPHACYVAVARRDDDRVTLRSLQADEAWEGRPADAGPGRVSGWLGYAAGVLWALAEDGLTVAGMDLLVDGRVPLGGGLSSSAALGCAVGLAAVVASDSEVDRERLVRLCVRAENEVVGAPTGGLDQAASLLCSPGEALLLDLADDSHRSVTWRPEDHGLRLIVVDTRVQHELGDGGYAARRADCERAAGLLGLEHLGRATAADVDRLDEERLRRRVRHVVTEIERVDAAVTAAETGDFDEVGRLFLASHASLRDDYEVSCAELDAVVATAVDVGAVGARMTGGGFGGSAIALVPEGRVEAVEQAVAGVFAARGWPTPGVVEAGDAVRAGAVGED